MKNKTRQRFLPVFIVLLVTVAGVSFFVGKTMSSSMKPVIVDQQIDIVPVAVKRTPPKTDYSDWQWKTVNKISFAIPSDWYLEQNTTIQNWDQSTVTRPGPLSGTMAKWDGYFLPVTGDLTELLFGENKQASETDVVELSQTVSGFPIYFVTSPGSKESMMEIPSVKMVIPLPSGEYLGWSGLSVKEENIETLKQIAESISIP